jgi:hypothetical protein
MEIYVGNLRQMLLQISIFKILNCVLSWFLSFSVNLFLRFHFVLQKTVLFRNLRDSSIIFAITNSANESVQLLRSFSLASYDGSKTKQNYQLSQMWLKPNLKI